MTTTPPPAPQEYRIWTVEQSASNRWMDRYAFAQKVYYPPSGYLVPWSYYFHQVPCLVMNHDKIISRTRHVWLWTCIIRLCRPRSSWVLSPYKTYWYTWLDLNGHQLKVSETALDESYLTLFLSPSSAMWQSFPHKSHECDKPTLGFRTTCIPTSLGQPSLTQILDERLN